MPQNVNQAYVAVNGIGATKVPGPLGKGTGGDLWGSSLHGTKYTQAVQSNLARGANPSAVTLSAALATTYVGLCLSNPAGNTKNLVLRRVSGLCIIAPGTFLAMGVIAGYAVGGITVHTTALTPASSLIGTGTAPTGKLDSACTLVGTPVWAAWLQSNAATGGNTNFSIDLEGGIVLPPGAYAAIGANAAGPGSGFLGSMEWEEIAI